MLCPLAILSVLVAQFFADSEAWKEPIIVPLASDGGCIYKGKVIDRDLDFSWSIPCERVHCSSINYTHGFLQREACQMPRPKPSPCRIRKGKGRYPRCCPRLICEGYPENDSAYD